MVIAIFLFLLYIIVQCVINENNAVQAHVSMEKNVHVRYINILCNMAIRNYLPATTGNIRFP